MPAGWDVKNALEEIMIELPTPKLDKVYVPTTRLEQFHSIPPRLFSRCLGMNLAVTYDENLNAGWTENFDQLRKVRLNKVGQVTKIVPDDGN